MHSIVMGIDGGGTRTKCAMATLEGTILSHGEAGPSNYHAVGYEKAYAAIHGAIMRCMDARAEPGHLAAACFGMAGVDRPEDHAVMADMARRLSAALGGLGVVRIMNDAAIALAAGTGGRPGAVLIAGTGSIAYGVNSLGQESRAGGWGHILGDEGSGYDIARKGLVAAMQAYDGRGPSTELEQYLAHAMGFASMGDCISKVYTELSRHDISALAPVVMKAAQRGDRVARDIVDRAGLDLAIAAATVIGRLGLGPESGPLIISGGVLVDGGPVLEAFLRHLAIRLRGWTVKGPAYPPVVGAVLLALRSLGIDGVEEAVARSWKAFISS